jgi:hypothetical protein
MFSKPPVDGQTQHAFGRNPGGAKRQEKIKQYDFLLLSGFAELVKLHAAEGVQTDRKKTKKNRQCYDCID